MLQGDTAVSDGTRLGTMTHGTIRLGRTAVGTADGMILGTMVAGIDLTVTMAIMATTVILTTMDIPIHVPSIVAERLGHALALHLVVYSVRRAQVIRRHDARPLEIRVPISHERRPQRLLVTALRLRRVQPAAALSVAHMVAAPLAAVVAAVSDVIVKYT